MSASTLHYQRIKTFVLAGIERGSWQAGARLPSENELAEQFSVSRMTVNRAIKELEADGVVERVQGKGTYVAAPRPLKSVLQIQGIDEEVRLRGNQYSCQVLQLRATRPTRALAEQLELNRGLSAQSLAHSLVLHLENEIPIQLEERWVRKRFWPKFLEQDFTVQTPHAFMMATNPFSQGEHVIEAVNPGKRIRKLLELAADEPVLLLHRRTWVGDQVASYVRLYHPGSRFQITTQLTQ